MDKSGNIDSGSPCLLHNCNKCCLETEMPLTKKDVVRIRKKGYKTDEFVIEKDGELHLRNRMKKCFFLKEGRCSIYEDRPEGCRIYPLIYDSDLRKFVNDELCPNRSEFNVEEANKDRIRLLLRRVEREKARRLKIQP